MVTRNRDKLADAVADRVRTISGSLTVKELLDDGECEALMKVERQKILISSSVIDFKLINCMGVAGKQLAMWLNLPFDLLIECPTNDICNSICRQIPGKRIIQLEEGEVCENEIQLRSMTQFRESPDRGSPRMSLFSASPSSSTSSGVYLVPPSVQRNHFNKYSGQSLSTNRERVVSQNEWCPFHPQHPQRIYNSVSDTARATSQSLDLVTLHGKVKLANASPAVLRNAPSSLRERLHQSLRKDIAATLGVPEAWVSVDLP
eukprot:TRINITY_DN34417_c0_g1_i1.p1 TRINITY_DN34417_c0_g1~~TRINITY_DN34417_c0_g1_i1.p1  ORF type:complete len:261 (+),score=47.65 TRINITY_DN34417_c0_g1_i1:63-845(+)